MIRTKINPLNKTNERVALRRRVRQMCSRFNAAHWDQCFSLIDPQLRDRGKVEKAAYAESLPTFQAAYGSIKPCWYVRISLPLNSAPNKHNDRPFA